MTLKEQKYYMGWLVVALNNEVGKNSHGCTLERCRKYATDSVD